MIPKYYILLALVIPSMLFSQDYYWYGHKKISLIPTDNKYVVIKNVDTDTATNVVEYASNNQYTDSTNLSQWCDQWNVLSHGYLGPDEPLYNAHTIIHSLEGDTIINDLVYQKLVGHLAISEPTPNVYIGAMRFAEDKKVFVYYDNNEYLLYDFNVQIGDTLNIFGGIEYYIDNKTLPHIVVNIDTLDDGRIKIISDAIIQEEINGIIHEEKRQKIWIEGIGSIDGIVYNTATTMYGSGKTILLCAYHNNDCCYTTDYTSYASLGCVYNDSFFTATEEVNSYAPSAQKIMYNGQLLILRDGKIYNITGVEVGE